MLKHKKLLSLLLAATMLFTVTGCGGGTDDCADRMLAALLALLQMKAGDSK